VIDKILVAAQRTHRVFLPPIKIRGRLFKIRPPKVGQVELIVPRVSPRYRSTNVMLRSKGVIGVSIKMILPRLSLVPIPPHIVRQSPSEHPIPNLGGHWDSNRSNLDPGTQAQLPFRFGFTVCISKRRNLSYIQSDVRLF